MLNIVQDALDEKKSKGPQKGYLLIQVGEQKFGIPMDQVVEVLESRRWNPLPVRRKNLLGVVNLRGIVFTIYDLAALLGKGATTSAESGQGCIIVVNDNRRKFGLWVEKMLYVQEFPLEDLHTLDDSQLLVSHLCVVENESILMMDVKRVA
ncbi:MAG: chemotaxis protein CheW [Silvanigrellaceae bacterium]